MHYFTGTSSPGPNTLTDTLRYPFAPALKSSLSANKSHLLRKE